MVFRPKFNIFWAIFIRIFLTFNTSVKEEISAKQDQSSGHINTLIYIFDFTSTTTLLRPVTLLFCVSCVSPVDVQRPQTIT
jgi:hypothetical protein